MGLQGVGPTLYLRHDSVEIRNTHAMKLNSMTHRCLLPMTASGCHIVYGSAQHGQATKSTIRDK